LIRILIKLIMKKLFHYKNINKFQKISRKYYKPKQKFIQILFKVRKIEWTIDNKV